MFLGSEEITEQLGWKGLERSLVQTEVSLYVKAAIGPEGRVTITHNERWWEVGDGAGK
jgi:hypothetical protein